MSTVAVLIADGTEEIEAVIVIDTLRRAKLSVTVVGVNSIDLTCSRDVRVIADVLFAESDMSSFDVLVIPGGIRGTETMMANSSVLDAVRAHNSAGKLLCAICAAPLVLQEAGILKGSRITCHPSVTESITEATCTGERLHMENNILTSQGPGTSFEFALQIIDLLQGEDAADAVRAGLIL